MNLFIVQTDRAQEDAAASPPEQPPPPPSPTPIDTATPLPTPTETPLPTPTATLVVNPNAGQEAAVAEGSQSLLPTPKATLDPALVTPTNTRVVQAPSAPQGTSSAVSPSSQANPSPAEMPVGGGTVTNDNGYLAWVGIGVLIILVLGLTLHLTKSPSSRLFK